MAKRDNTMLIVIGFILLAILMVMLFSNQNNKNSEVYVVRPNEVTRNVYIPRVQFPGWRRGPRGPPGPPGPPGPSPPPPPPPEPPVEPPADEPEGFSLY